MKDFDADRVLLDLVGLAGKELFAQIGEQVRQCGRSDEALRLKYRLQFRALLGEFDRFGSFHGHLPPREPVRDGWNDCNVSAASPLGKALTVYEGARAWCNGV